MKTQILFALLLCGMAPVISRASDFDSLCADRVAIERVYYRHRLGTKPPFEQVMPREVLEKLVRQELHKEAVLKKVYGIEITPAMLEAEVRRIDSTTRAPDLLAELEAALGNDTNRFARVVAGPIVAERFALYLCEERTPEILPPATLSVPKRSYEQWLSEPGDEPAARK